MGGYDFDDAGRDGGDPLRAGDNAKPYEPKGGRKSEHASDNANEYKANGSDDPFKLICLADVQEEPIEWLWRDYLARGKLALFGGDPDTGKSQLLIDIAARQSSGRHWPFGGRANVASTIFICSEDGVADTVKPRAVAAGADVSKLFVFNSTIIKDGKRRGFTLQNDLDLLGDAITKVGDAGLVVFDAITSYMGKIETNSTTDVRAVLDPIAEWAEALKVSAAGVTHPPKAAQRNAIRQFTGSFAYIAAPRLGFFVTKEPDTDRTLLLAVKNNLGPKAPGRGYRIATKEIGYGIVAPYLQWDDAPVDYTADQAIAANNAANKGGSALEDAKEFLRELLADGPINAKEGDHAAKANGIAERTLYRARKDLGVTAKHDDSFEGGWKWTL